MNRLSALAAALAVGLGIPPARAADEPPAVEKLIEQLGSPSFPARERATKLLRERGPAALPALRKALESKDEEVRKRAEVLIPPLEIEEALLPKRVTLKANGLTASAAVAELAKQTGFKLAAMGKDDGKKVTADLKDVPFWDAMEAIGQQTGRGCSFQTHDRTLRLNSGTGRSPFVNVRGPFRLEATWFHEDRDVDFTRAAKETAGRRGHKLTLAVSVLAEPRLTFLRIRPAQVDEAVDSEGNSLLEPTRPAPPSNGPPGLKPPATPDSADVYPSGRGTFRGETTDYSDIRLRRSNESARSAKLIRGTIPVRAVLIRKPVVVSAKVNQAGGTSFRAGTDSITIKQVTNQGGSLHIEFHVPRQENDPVREWQQRFEVEDEAGNRFQKNGWGTSSDGRNYWITLYFSPPFNKANVGPPAKLIFEDWVVHDHAIPFEFRDVPLP